MIHVFISSVQKEFTQERQSLRDFIRNDALLKRFFDVFIFEEIPASGLQTEQVYLDKVKQCDIYIGLFGQEYGDATELSPTEREYQLAEQLNKIRLIFVKGYNDEQRDPKMNDFIVRVGKQLIRKRFESIPELTAGVYASLIQYMEHAQLIRTGPFDAAACAQATLDDISEEKMRWFLKQSRAERQYTIDPDTPVKDVLTHMNLLDKGIPTHAAILLFGQAPQRFMISSEVKCMHFHDTTIQKPIPSYHIYKGTVFELVNQSVDFIMSKINRAVGERTHGAQAPVEYEIPEPIIAEGIVNAIAHRDYTSHASVQVMLFSDRLEIWNPGELRSPLTLPDLSKPHPSIPTNPLLAEPLFLAKYIEKAGSGTLDMGRYCAEAGLRAPEFRLEMGCFILTIWRKTSEFVAQSPTQLPTQSPTQSINPKDDPISRLLKALGQQELSSSELRKILGIKHRPTFRNNYINPALYNGWIELTIPDKPNSRLQKYRITDKGIEVNTDFGKDK